MSRGYPSSFEEDMRRLYGRAPAESGWGGRDPPAGERRAESGRSWSSSAVVAAGLALVAFIAYNRISNKIDEARKQRLPIDDATAAKLKAMFRNTEERSREYENVGKMGAAIASLNTAISEMTTVELILTKQQIRELVDIDVDSWKGAIEARRALLQDRYGRAEHAADELAVGAPLGPAPLDQLP
jgi:hypothetical protein